MRCAGRNGLAVDIVLRLERRAAAAGRYDVRIVDREATVEAVDEVDSGAHQIRAAGRIDDHRDTVSINRLVIILNAVIETECVLETRAATTLDRNTKDLSLTGRLLARHLDDLLRCVLCDRDHASPCL